MTIDHVFVIRGKLCISVFKPGRTDFEIGSTFVSKDGDSWIIKKIERMQKGMNQPGDNWVFEIDGVKPLQ